MEPTAGEPTPKKQSNKPYRWGVLVANTGTPQSPTAKDVKDYLEQFLSDRQIIRYPKWFWWPILHGIILKIRPEKSAKKYARIWTDEGSPLLTGTRKIARGLEEQLTKTMEENIKVATGMSYGLPKLSSAYKDLQKDCEQILLLPLFPQHSAVTTGSIQDALSPLGPYMCVGAYYELPTYIQLLAKCVRSHWKKHGQAEKLLISFHGIPVRYSKNDPYYAQCKYTAKALSEALKLTEDQWIMCFQSKFGPEPWLEPATANTAVNLAKNGIKTLDVIAPSFAVDCLETLDELSNELRWSFEENGGKNLRYIPALGYDKEHIELLANICAKIMRS